GRARAGHGHRARRLQGHQRGGRVGRLMALLAPHFPVMDSGVDYLDSAATSQTPSTVIDAMDEYYREYRASIHRGVYPLAARATDAYEAARIAIAGLVNGSPSETILTRNATEALNLVAYSWGGANLREGDVIVLTEMEHHSN